jgi:hypothetical protein
MQRPPSDSIAAISPGQELAFGSNAVRLTARQWAIAAAVVVVVCASVPWLWQRIEPFQPGPDYRIPYVLGNDYWHFARYCRLSCNGDNIVVLGDSMVWGEYVTPGETLTHHLNAAVDAGSFVNLGVNGIHPIALHGLIRYYGRALSGRNVVIHYNPLWMSSPRHDLQTDKEFRFNHPKLVPQFFPRIPCYRNSLPERMGIAMERYLPFRAWANHLAIAYFDSTALVTWARENPYANPLRQITLQLPGPEPVRRHEPVSWTERGMQPAEFHWVEADTSLQWRFFQRAVRTLRARQNNVFVLVGPFNEHMLTADSLTTYETIKRAIEIWLEDEQIAHHVPAPLPSELYADASHPLDVGYARIVADLSEHESFQAFLRAVR